MRDRNVFRLDAAQVPIAVGASETCSASGKNGSFNRCTVWFSSKALPRTKLCYISPVMKTCVAFGFYFWFAVPGGREANV
jgi:hypothetical protein